MVVGRSRRLLETEEGDEVGDEMMTLVRCGVEEDGFGWEAYI
jgi:hypothetical protein